MAKGAQEAEDSVQVTGDTLQGVCQVLDLVQGGEAGVPFPVHSWGREGSQIDRGQVGPGHQNPQQGASGSSCGLNAHLSRQTDFQLLPPFPESGGSSQSPQEGMARMKQHHPSDENKNTTLYQGANAHSQVSAWRQTQEG